MSTTNPQQAPPFNPDDLIHRRVVESHRVEFKSTWNHVIKAAVLRSICAFANDLLNLNGGYVVLGIEETGGRPDLPPCGLGNLDLDRIQKEVFGICKSIQPEYQPYLYPLEFQGEPILIIWVPGGSSRPYQVPEDVNRKGSRRRHFIRQGPQTIRAQGEFLNQLMAFAAKVPFDDRRSLKGRLEDLSPTLVRRFLHEVGSALVRSEPPVRDLEIFRKLRLVVPINAHEVPINVALLFFNENPEKFFPGAQIDVVDFPEGAGGDSIDEQIFTGPLAHQVRSALNHVRGLIKTRIRKIPDQAEAERSMAYPLVAVEEALVNAVYHRAYDGDPEPIKVYLYPDRMELTSYPGPAAGLEKHHFLPGATVPSVPRRNRRIGDLLKELELAEARSSGIEKIHNAMRHNGSPEAQFDFDDTRTYFRVILPKHMDHRAVVSMRAEKSSDPVYEIMPATVLVTDLVNSTKMTATLGNEQVAGFWMRHYQVCRRLLAVHRGQEVSRSDGIMALFKRPVHAMLYALDYHQAMDTLSKDMGKRFVFRVGIHFGEVTVIKTSPAAGSEPGAQEWTNVEGVAKVIAERLTDLARGGQTLLSKSAYDLARSAAESEPLPEETRWLSHGFYQMTGIEEPLDIFEVGLEGLSPLSKPDDTGKARRVTTRGA